DLGGRARVVGFTPDGSALAAVGQRLLLWAAASGRPVRPPDELADCRCELFRFAADGKTLVTAVEGRVSVWEWPAGRLARTLELPADGAGPGKPVCTGLALSGDGQTLVTLSERRWESKVGEFTRTNSE